MTTTRLSQAEVERAFERLREGTSESQDLSLFEAMATELDTAQSHPDAEHAPCPACQSWVVPAYGTDHLRSCPSHPARLRLLALRRALLLAPSLHRSLATPKTFVQAVGRPESHPELVRRADAVLQARPELPAPAYVPSGSTCLEQARRLTRESRARHPSLVQEAQERLSAGIDAWRRHCLRETDPCPHCGTVLDLSEVIDHTMTCTGHPAEPLVLELEATLATLFGSTAALRLEALAAELERYLRGLEDLVADCTRFDSELGWNGTDAYCEHEGLLRGAEMRATALLGALRRATGWVGRLDLRLQRAPPSTRPAWAALQRIASGAGAASDETLLREVIHACAPLRSRLPESVTCPACQRGPVALESALSHLDECPWHPARCAEREAAAALGFGLGVAGCPEPPPTVPAVPLQLLSHPVDDRTALARDETWIASQRQADLTALQHLLATPSDRAVEEVATILRTWEAHTLASAPSCPHCGVQASFPSLLQHLVSCPAHPCLARAQASEDRLQTLGLGALEPIRELRRSTDAVQRILVELTDYVSVLPCYFGEDEWGRAVVHARLQPTWKQMLRRGQETLERHAVQSPAP